MNWFDGSPALIRIHWASLIYFKPSTWASWQDSFGPLSIRGWLWTPWWSVASTTWSLAALHNFATAHRRLIRMVTWPLDKLKVSPGKLGFYQDHPSPEIAFYDLCFKQRYCSSSALVLWWSQAAYKRESVFGLRNFVRWNELRSLVNWFILGRSLFCLSPWYL